MHSACVHVHVHVHMYMYTCTCTHVHAHVCGYTSHLCTCRYATIHVNRPSGISQAAAIAVNHTQGVNITYITTVVQFQQIYPILTSIIFTLPVCNACSITALFWFGDKKIILKLFKWQELLLQLSLFLNHFVFIYLPVAYGTPHLSRPCMLRLQIIIKLFLSLTIFLTFMTRSIIMRNVPQLLTFWEMHTRLLSF